MSAISGGGNYISDGQIMEWLAVQQNRIYGELGESMDISTDRSHFTEELSKIKGDLHEANKNHDFKNVDAELQAFMEKYGSDPRFSELCDGLRGIADRVHQDVQAAEAINAADHGGEKVTDPDLVGNGGAHNATVPAGVTITTPSRGGQSMPFMVTPGTTVQAGQQPSQSPTPPKQVHYDDDTMKDWDDLIASKTDLVNKNDQLTMIHIQELRSTLDQGSQLASAFISSGDKTSSAIINNIA